VSHTVRFAISLDHDLLEDFDQLCACRHYESRSEAIRDLIRDRLVEQNWDDKSETMGTITIVFNHHVRDLTEKLTSIQHDHHRLILSTLHVHIDHDHCLEVLVVKGTGRDIRGVADSLISTKGVKHGKLTMTTAGQEFI
jgi:CopG family nickel-responsive transcriptional regulator